MQRSQAPCYFGFGFLGFSFFHTSIVVLPISPYSMPLACYVLHIWPCTCPVFTVFRRLSASFLIPLAAVASAAVSGPAAAAGRRRRLGLLGARAASLPARGGPRRLPLPAAHAAARSDPSLLETVVSHMSPLTHERRTHAVLTATTLAHTVITPRFRKHALISNHGYK